MNQEKIGNFIAQCRKEKNLTQAQLAEKLNVTDRAISKWETAKGMPDSSIMIPLCNELDITVNELLTGEKIKKEDYLNQAENNLIELKKYIENQNRSKFILSYIFRIVNVILSITLLYFIFFAQIDSLTELIFIIVCTILCFTCLFTAAEIELTTGYYQCSNCGHKYIPNRQFFSFTMQVGNRRFLKCPKCHTRNWHKKALNK